MNISEAYKKIGVKGPRYVFPPALKADRQGLVAVGADLEPATLITAYSNGIFPWTYNPITWWSPNPRAIFEIEKFTLKKRMMRYLKNTKLEFTFDKAFEEVVKGCAKPSARRGLGWITSEFVRAYVALYKLGFAHSTEAWLDKKLVGGVYGVSLGGLFAGESMFSTVSNASTLALYHLMKRLKKGGFVLFDSQVINDHTRFLGAVEIDAFSYLKRLKSAILLDCVF